MGICTGRVSSRDNPIYPVELAKPTVAPDVIADNILNYYTFIRVIGNGHYGMVREARKIYSKTELHFAVKSIAKDNVNPDLEVMRRELSILRAVDHPNIIKFYEVYED